MKAKDSIIFIAVALCTVLDASAQIVVERPDSCSPSTQHLRGAACASPVGYTHAIVRCADAEQLVDCLRHDGIEATAITATVATVRLYTHLLSQLYLYPGVESVQLSRTGHLAMVKARQATECDRVQNGDIVMIPSDFSDAEVLEDIKFVQKLADKRNALWVVNMSFGTQIGAHDGTSTFSRAVDDILTSGTGRAIVIAAGNENVYVQHAQHTFKEDGEMVRLLVSSATGASGALIDLWGQQADGQRHLTVRPFLYVNGKYDYKTDDFWKNYEWTSQIADFNNKEHYFLRMRSASLVGQMGFEITGEKGVTFHAWTNSGYGNFVKGPDDTFIEGDTNYCVDDFGSSINHAVVAAAYVTSNTWVDYNGKTRSDVRGTEGDIANFSSHGPSLSSVQPCKPTVAAPGSCIISAVAKTGASFDVTSSSIASVVKINSLKRFYYEQMSGTSMASPATAGIIALWLQANPGLSSAQILDIIKTTSTKDSFTGDAAWNATWGYGKINAYEGLKEALRLGGSTGVPQISASSTPVTVLRGGDVWKLLFGSNESFANVEVYTLDGKKVTDWHFEHLSCGDEKTIIFGGLAPGAYIVKVKTTNCLLSRKLLKV